MNSSLFLAPNAQVLKLMARYVLLIAELTSLSLFDEAVTPTKICPTLLEQ